MRALLRGFVVTATVVTVVSGGVAWAAPPTSAPTITSGPAANSYTNQTSATFQFTHADGSATFTCSLDAAKATACTSPISYTGLKAKTHTFTVRATVPGKKQSKPTNRSWTVDLTAPNTPTVSQPTSPTMSTTASITFSDTSTDVLSYLCSLDGVAATACTSPKSLSGLGEGYHTFTVQAVDRASNVSAARTVVWAIDNSVSAPFISTAPPSTSGPDVAFEFDTTDSDIASFSCSMDSAAPGSYATCTSPKPYTGLSAGSHTFRVKATDAVGNVSTVTSYTWTVQTPPPVTLAWDDPSALPAAVTNITGGVFAFSATGQTSVACTLDGTPQATCTSPETLSGLADGTHAYSVVASPGAVTLAHTWKVDTVAPDAPTLVGPSARVASTDANIAVVPAAVGDVVTCTVDGLDTDCSTAINLTGLSEGGHNVTATAADTAGNTSQASLDWTVDTTGPDVTATAPTTLTGPFVVDFDEDTSGVDASSVLVTDEAGKTLTTTLACKDEAADPTDCTNTDVRRVELSPAARLMLGQHYRVQVNPLGSELVMDDLGNVSAAVDDSVRATKSAGESSAGATFAWHTVKDKKAKGGSYVTEHRKGARASWTFSGKAVTWYTLTGPNQGKADVFVDGVRKTTVNNYAKSVKHGVARTVKGLAKGTHTIEVRVLGKKGSRHGKGTFVGVDGFKVGKKVTATPTLTKVAWQRATNASASGGTYSVADIKAESMKVKVRGTSVTVKSARGPAYGKAGVYVDGKLKKTVDLYAKKLSWGYKMTVTGLTDAVHTVQVKVLGSKNKRSNGTGVVVDGVSVT